jgi:S1-C subfamily serine protease
MRHPLDRKQLIDRNRPTPLIVFACLISVLAVPTAAMAEGIPGRWDSEERRTVILYERLAPITVSLSTTYSTNAQSPGPQSMGVGSGFIVDEEGTVLTNAHVVEGATTITASLFDGARVAVDVLAVDAATDIAILRLPKTQAEFIPATLGDSEQLRVGQKTLVVGSPFGLGFTLTNGIISGFQPASGRAETLSSKLIQTTAPINPGNSGGPLVDSQGHVIGMSKAVVLGAQNIGFAIPINLAKQVLAEFKEKGRIARPWLGIGGKFVTEDLQRLFVLPLIRGLLIEHVDDASPAYEAGLRAGTLNVVVEGMPWTLGGDILTRLQGHAIRTPDDFAEALRSVDIGDEIQLELFRHHEYVELSVRLNERPVKSIVKTNPWHRDVMGPISGCGAGPSSCVSTIF